MLEYAGESPSGFQAAGYGIRVSEAAAWAGGSHGAGSENHLLRPKLVFGQWSASCSGGPDTFASGVEGGEKKMREAEE